MSKEASLAAREKLKTALLQLSSSHGAELMELIDGLVKCRINESISQMLGAADDSHAP